MHPNEELWISRAIDRRASVEDWRELAAVARSDADVWRRLSHTLRDESLLAQRVEAALPVGDVPLEVPSGWRRSGGRVTWLVTFAAAAVLVLTFWLGRISIDIAEGGAGVTATRTAPVPSADPNDLLAAYLEIGRQSGRVLEPLPLRTLATRRLPGGEGLEVVFVRSFVERTQVQSALAMAPDEHGRPTPLQVDLAHYIPPTNF